MLINYTLICLTEGLTHTRKYSSELGIGRTTIPSRGVADNFFMGDGVVVSIINPFFFFF